MSHFPKHPRLALLAFGLLLLVLSGCADSKPILLGITGYNYTDRYIDSFDVDGQGGGNVFLSDEEGGGGKTSCCMGYNPKRALPIKMTVRWTWGTVEDSNQRVIRSRETASYEAELRGPVPKDPRFLEVHFMPDGTVRLLITAESSAPLVNVDRGPEKR